MEVKFYSTQTQLNAVLDVLIELRSQFTHDDLHRQIVRQMQAGYHLVYLESYGKVLAVAGFVVGEKLAWGKHIYIDDLVVSQNARSAGVGAFFIDWFKGYCREIGAKQLHLDSGIQRFPAHRFYLRERFNIASHHFSITKI